MTDKPINMTRPLDMTHEKRNIGPQRIQRPIYQDSIPTCNNACPAGENIQAWLTHAQAGSFKQAWQKLTEENPLPAVHGRVCYHPCETACNRDKLDAPVSIHAIERFLGDKALEEDWQYEITAQPSGKRVLIVGAGPSGLSAAYHLARLGHTVEIHEAGPVAGGMMHFGIPAYRLPRDVLDGEIKRIENMGVNIVLNHRVDDLLTEKKAGNFDAMFVAVGAHLSKRTDIPSRDAGKMLDALGFLKEVESGNVPKLGRRVAIYGGGNTAMDAARVAKRLGHEPMIIYRRDREHMPAHDFEADEALEEGVKIHWLRTIKAIEETTFTVEVMEIDEATGRPRPTGEIETIEADALIMALGQDVDTSFLGKIPDLQFKSDGVVEVDENMMTHYPGLFAGGDMVPSDRTVTIGVGHGKKAARNIDAWLRGDTYNKPPKGPIATFDKLHVWYYTDAAQRPQGHLDMKKRQSSFEEVVGGLGQKEAVYEAKRCLSCGNCYECDGCYGACPEDAIIKLGPGRRYRYNYDLCTGCAVCFEQCPCHAIEMTPEP
ncbi:MAG: glutamate synthase [Candidatus Contendobacter odensis]|uniref:Glutamate synthase n=1 Tax=Candidatus Contendibacter odensensis TaxID=1400860 RepID=A0A2G6PFR7_9GAMM|nr:MAG: glutamate synthase [Candidatus Contendobacter odensis]